ncbi:MAG TPA: hypothetical protein RMH99_25450 [Sandaracinaceae bacterium LLY-WYZ-13_1]|nr:hypothetical protein [Sandaracinaceae bacterium LLY-WYZ-13_1]
MGETRRKWMMVGGVALLASTSLACLTPRAGDDVEVTRAELAGVLGSWEGGDDARVAAAGEHYVELRSSGAEGALMAGLRLDDGLSSLATDREHHFEDGRGAGMLGCAGPSEGYWEFDSYADEVTVEVEQVDERTRRVWLSAAWSDGSGVIASFDYTPTVE